MNTRQIAELLPASVRLVDGGGQFVRRLKREAAYALVRNGQASLVRGRVGERIRAVQLIVPDNLTYISSRPNGRRYSHDAETGDNPAGVWTLRRIPRRDRYLYRAVIDDCLAARKNNW